MIKFLLGASTALVLLTSIFMISPKDPDFEKITSSTLKIETEAENGHGSGVALTNGYIVSSAHVVGDKKSIIVKTKDGRSFTAKVIKLDKDKDIAILRHEQEDLKTSNLSCNPVYVGQRIISSGNPMAFDFITTFGRVASKEILEPNENKLTILVADLTVAPGMSGGPAYNTDGDVIGINTAMLIAPLKQATPTSPALVTYSRLSILVTAEEICRALKTIK